MEKTKRLPTVRVRRSKSNPDFWEVTQNGRVRTRHMSKRTAEKAAEARRNVLRKRKKRSQTKK